MISLPPTIKAFYSPTDDMYVVDYEEAVIAICPDAAESTRCWRWGMFTHGVCADVDDTGRFLWKRVGITGRHLTSEWPERNSLGERLDQAADRLSIMLSKLPTPARFRFEEGTRLLRTYREAIIEALLLSWREGTERAAAGF